MRRGPWILSWATRQTERGRLWFCGYAQSIGAEAMRVPTCRIETGVSVKATRGVRAENAQLHTHPRI